MYRCVTERTRKVGALTVLYNGHSCFVAVKISEKLGENSELTRRRELAESFVAVRERGHVWIKTGVRPSILRF